MKVKKRQEKRREYSQKQNSAGADLTRLGAPNLILREMGRWETGRTRSRGVPVKCGMFFREGKWQFEDRLFAVVMIGYLDWFENNF